MAETTEFAGHRGLQLSNGEVEVFVTTDFGPRVLRYARAGGENMMGVHPEAAVPTDLGEWRPLGGHRLWVAPEGMLGSYAPDDGPVEVREDGALSAAFSRAADAAGFAKELVVTLDASGSGVMLTHRITNAGPFPVEVAPWAITIVRGGGEVLLPHEPFRAHGDALLPARPLVLWPFTDMNDPRWTWGERFVRLRTDPDRAHPQKVGAGNSLGWCAYRAGGDVYVKRFGFDARARYPDFGANCETYVAGDYAEVESLGPLAVLAPGESAEHVERWSLHGDVELGETDAELAAALEALL